MKKKELKATMKEASEYIDVLQKSLESERIRVKGLLEKNKKWHKDYYSLAKTNVETLAGLKDTIIQRDLLKETLKSVL